MLAFTQTKGGTGKSTLAASLTLWLHDRGIRVGLLDSDRQQTAARWVKAAEPSIAIETATSIDEIRAARVGLLSRVDFIIADTPGASVEASQTVTLTCDLAVVPLQPSIPDLSALSESLKYIRLGQEMTGQAKPKYVLVLNLVGNGDLQARKLRAELERQGMPVARSQVRRLNGIRDACDTCLTRSTLPQLQTAVSDLNGLFEELLKLVSLPSWKQVVHG